MVPFLSAYGDGSLLSWSCSQGLDGIVISIGVGSFIVLLFT